MFKPSLGLGTKLGAAANKSDLNSYLKNLKKKQKEISKKHAKDESEDKTSTEEEDSDLASIAREFQDEEDSESNIFHNSPFIKKPNQPKVRHFSDNTTPLPEKEFSFISSNKSTTEEPLQPLQPPNASKALDQFMKFDRKYATIKAPNPADLDTDESEPIEKSTNVQHGKSRLRRQAEQAGLKLSIPKISAESTTSEISDHLDHLTPIQTHSPRSPRSPMFTLENLHDIEELFVDDNDEQKEKTPDFKDNIFKFEPPAPQDTVEKSLADEADEVIVTEDDIDEDLIEIDLSLQSGATSVIENVAKDDDFKEEIKIVKETPSLKKSETTETETSEISETVTTLKKEKKHKRKHKKVKKSCYYCENVCEYHLSKLQKPDKSEKSEKEKKAKKEKKQNKPKVATTNESVQVGVPNVKYGHGHYMFDPLKDAMHQNQIYNNDHLAFIRSAWTQETQIHQELPLLNGGNQTPMAYALSELLKGQLELTANFLSTQKTLYANYCASLSNFVPDTRFDSFDKVIHPRKYTEAEDKIETIAEEYESEFESASEEDDTIVPPTEISVSESNLS